jgi:NAD(P)-dependent dehydrogenase (short-subunit alcohol dehydrogenase family)
MSAVIPGWIDALLDRTVVGGYTRVGYALRSRGWSDRELHVLVNNAGVLAPRRTVTTDGIELAFAVNVLAPFLLTQMLLDCLRHAAPSRIVNVSSGGMYTQRLHVARLVSGPPFPVSIGRPDPCCAQSSRARTRSSGLERPRSRRSARGSSGTIAAGGRRTCSPAPGNRPPTASGCGANAHG